MIIEKGLVCNSSHVDYHIQQNGFFLHEYRTILKTVYTHICVHSLQAYLCYINLQMKECVKEFAQWYICVCVCVCVCSMMWLIVYIVLIVSVPYTPHSMLIFENIVADCLNSYFLHIPQSNKSIQTWWQALAVLSLLTGLLAYKKLLLNGRIVRNLYLMFSWKSSVSRWDSLWWSHLLTLGNFFGSIIT